MKRNIILLLVCGLFSAVFASSAGSQDYPARPVRMVVPYPAGGGADFVGRLLAQGLSERLGQQVFVDNRSGAGGTIGTTFAAKAAPDGLTIYLAAANLAWSVSLFENLPYDPLMDFSAVGLVARTPSILAVNPTLPANSIKELIALAKASPGKINSAGGTGTSMQTDMELFKAMARIEFAQIPYRGTAPAVLATLSGEVSVIIAPTIALLPHVRSGALRALAISGEQRSPALAELPTIAEAGLPGFETYQWYGVLVPSRTPRAIVVRLNQQIGELIRAPKVERLLASQALTAATDTPEEFDKFVRAQITKWAKVLKPTDAPPL